MHMPIDPLLGLALFMPFLFAIAATVLSFRFIRQRLLFFLVTVFTFAGVQDLAYAPIPNLASQKQQPVAEMIRDETRGRFIADIVAAVVGGLIVWRTAKVFQVNDRH